MTTALPDLRADLVAGVRATNTRRRRRRRAVAAASATLACAAVALTVVVPGAGGPAPALAIERGPEVVELRIADATADADRMTADLRAAGVDGEVRTVPVGPDRVGSWVVKAEIARDPVKRLTPSDVEAAADVRGEVVRLGAIELTDEVIRIPVERVRDGGRFVFFAGVAARPGETPLPPEGAPFPPGLLP